MATLDGPIGPDVDVAELREGFLSDNDSVCAIVDGGDEELSSLLERGHKSKQRVLTGDQEPKAFRTLKTVLALTGVIMVMTMAVAGGGYYAYGGESSSGESGGISSITVGDSSTIKLSDALNASPTLKPTSIAPRGGYSSVLSAMAGEDAEDGNANYGSMTEDEQKTLFDVFLSTFNKAYDNDTTTMERFTKFKNNLKIIDERNAAERARGGTAVHGVTKFSDYDDEEFAAAFLVASPMGASSGAIMTEVPEYVGEEDIVTWEGLYTKGIVDQGYCGACWAYSVTEQMQADAIRAGLINLNTTLSAQQILSCDTTSFGCGGGWTERAYQYVQLAGGVALDEDYPYTSYYDMTGACKEDPSQYYMTTDGYYTVGSEQAMIDYVKSTGPLSACVDATNWATYVKGVVTVCGNTVDHCVQIIGVDTVSEEGYWLIRNSWGTSWGEGGYIRLSVGNDTCAVSNDPTFSKPVLLTAEERRELRGRRNERGLVGGGERVGLV